MKHIRYTIAGVSLATLCSATVLSAQDTAPKEADSSRCVFTLLDDNDFFGKWSDKYYTNHTRFALTLGAEKENAIHNALFFSFGQEIYTPKEYKTTALDPRDHPYAGYLYGSIGQATYDEDFALMKEIQIGATGDRSIADKVQCEFHRFSEDPIPQGWDSQIHDRFVVQAIADIRKRFMLEGSCGNDAFGADLIVHGFGGLGNLRGQLSAGTQIRAGWNLPKDFGTFSTRQSASAVLDPEVDASIYAFFDLQGDAILWDKTLTGNNDYGQNINAYPFAAQATLGLQLIYDRYALTFFQSVRTKDFSTQDNDFFAYGGFKFSVAF